MIATLNLYDNYLLPLLLVPVFVLVFVCIAFFVLHLLLVLMLLIRRVLVVTGVLEANNIKTRLQAELKHHVNFDYYDCFDNRVVGIQYQWRNDKLGNQRRVMSIHRIYPAGPADKKHLLERNIIMQLPNRISALPDGMFGFLPFLVLLVVLVFMFFVLLFMFVRILG